MPLRTHRQNGFSLIELLIALLILAIGLLGMASLMMTSMKSNQSASMRSQASWLAYDIIERMRSNSTEAIQGNEYVIAAAAAAPADPDCKNNVCNAGNVAKQDMFEWKTKLADAALSGEVSHASNAYTVIISWQEDSSTACGVNNQCSFTLRADL
jgi:type IV pilus assembly protein PilV